MDCWNYTQETFFAKCECVASQKGGEIKSLMLLYAMIDVSLCHAYIF